MAKRKTPKTPKKKAVAKKSAAKPAKKVLVKPVKAKSGSGGKGKWVYAFGGGKAEGKSGMKNLLGGKGANLAEMANLGLPVPPGFTVTTQACNAFLTAGGRFPPGMWEQVLDAEKALERKTG